MAADTLRISALFESPWRCEFSHADYAKKSENVKQVCSEASQKKANKKNQQQLIEKG